MGKLIFKKRKRKSPENRTQQEESKEIRQLISQIDKFFRVLPERISGGR